MKNLLLLRHAKSSWADGGLSDFQRPLNGRGERAAVVMANHLADNFPLPDVILCSSAQRTRQTLAALLDVYAHEMDVIIRRDLYLAATSTKLSMLQALDDKVETVMMIGHNPGTEELAMLLCEAEESRAYSDLYMKYPTAACAHISFKAKCWSDLKARTGKLMNFVKPRDLE